MASPQSSSVPGKRSSGHSTAVIPIFVCPGVRIVPIEHIVFPIGDGCSEVMPCPVRECCVWYCQHDLGGRDSLFDFPDAAILEGEFRIQPFHCDDYTPAKDS